MFSRVCMLLSRCFVSYFLRVFSMSLLFAYLHQDCGNVYSSCRSFFGELMLSFQLLSFVEFYVFTHIVQ